MTHHTKYVGEGFIYVFNLLPGSRLQKWNITYKSDATRGWEIVNHGYYGDVAEGLCVFHDTIRWHHRWVPHSREQTR